VLEHSDFITAPLARVRLQLSNNVQSRNGRDTCCSRQS